MAGMDRVSHIRGTAAMACVLRRKAKSPLCSAQAPLTRDATPSRRASGRPTRVGQTPVMPLPTGTSGGPSGVHSEHHGSADAASRSGRAGTTTPLIRQPYRGGRARTPAWATPVRLGIGQHRIGRRDSDHSRPLEFSAVCRPRRDTYVGGCLHARKRERGPQGFILSRAI